MVCTLAFGQQVYAAAPTDTADLQRQRAQLLIDHLGDPDAAVRHSAQLQLNSLSGDALDIVEKAAARDDLDPETQIRLKNSLAILRPREHASGDWQSRSTIGNCSRCSMPMIARSKYDDDKTTRRQRGDHPNICMRTVRSETRPKPPRESTRWPLARRPGRGDASIGSCTRSTDWRWAGMETFNSRDWRSTRLFGEPAKRDLPLLPRQ